MHTNPHIARVFVVLFLHMESSSDTPKVHGLTGTKRPPRTWVAGVKAGTTVKRTLARNYVLNRMANAQALAEKKITKKEIALSSGYALGTVERGVLEKTGIYTELSHDFISKVGYGLEQFLDTLTEAVNNGEHLDLPIEKKIRATATLATIYKGLLPTFKKKETKREIDGTITSVWTTLNQ